ncbi:M48 family metallopeptidase [Thiocystis violacea]|uniref:M48 family metallopeptidase n=1 Tax=Thiocystis violacea TaxID=13725 RepID=UPI001903996F|nr:SprT family zinc-dependent metalloprotease [Thiocystis violacea]MBK1717699.1 hypothetical protein [Thiocystis violacea]
MSGAFRVQLPDGRAVDFKIRRSARARAVWLRVNPHEGLVVTAPKDIGLEALMDLVHGRSDWIARQWPVLDGIRSRQANSVGSRPDRLELRAIDESWTLEYQETDHGSASVRIQCAGRLLVRGAPGDPKVCRAALRRWLMSRAREAFAPWLEELARETGLNYTRLSVRTQRSRWGSCTRQGHISLNAKLLFLPRPQVRYVMLHELCHTRELNHSPAYWALVRQHEPDLESIRRQMRDAWTLIPHWLDAS